MSTYGLAHVIAQGHWDDGHMDGGWWVLMMFGVLLVLALLVIGIVWLVQGRGAIGGQGRSDRPTPLEVLDRRLAEGALSVEEYEQRRRLLTSSDEPRNGEP